MRIDLLLMFGAFAAASAVAGLLGAENTGTAFFFGQVAFAAAVVWIIVRRDQRPPSRSRRSATRPPV